MVSILRRPLDLLIVVIFASFLLIAATIDYTQSLYGSVLAEEDIDAEGLWPPYPVLKAYAWWCENVDPLLAHNPSWYTTMATLSPFLYIPFYCFGIYAFIMEREWIRIPTLMWGYGLLLTMVVVAVEQLKGPYPTKNVKLFFIAYGPYALMPIIIMARVAFSPVFGSKTSSSSSQAVNNNSTKMKGGKKQKLKGN